ncbi:hypothetical protein VTL71DRAFT_12989 [Oculimacula yallundae]|uniref:Uncharacterized protein n=1 Tax=Oculimacula yallundae TaxID=86028 RepID=A0ABR4CP92_9HELO
MVDLRSCVLPAAVVGSSTTRGGCLNSARLGDARSSLAIYSLQECRIPISPRSRKHFPNEIITCNLDRYL